MKRLPVVGLFLSAAVLMSGCKKVADEKTSDLEPGKIVFYSVPAVKSLTVDFSTNPSAPLDVYVVADKDAEKAKADLQNGKEPASPLANQKGASGTITVNSSAKTEMTILVTSNKKTTVTVKMNGS
jgi:hypothetical protein